MTWLQLNPVIYRPGRRQLLGELLWEHILELTQYLLYLHTILVRRLP